MNKYKAKIIKKSNYIQTMKGEKINVVSYITTKTIENNNDSKDFKISYSLFPLIVK